MPLSGTWRTRIVLGTAPLFLAACAAMLGIEELPVAARDAGVDADGPGPVDAATDVCNSPEASFCARACPPFDFCDDFEGEGPDFFRWQTPGVVPKPFRSGAFSGTLDLVASTPDHGTVLVAQSESHDNVPQTIGLIDLMPKSTSSAKPRGIATVIKSQLGDLGFPDDADVSRRVGLFGVGASALPLPVALIVVYDEGNNVGIAVQQRSVGGNEHPTDILRVDGVPRVALQAAFPELELVVGPRSVLLANKFPCTVEDAGVADGGAPQQADPMVAYARAFGFARCAPLIDPLADPSWLASPVVFVGVNISDFGRVKYTFDDVAAHYLF